MAATPVGLPSAPFSAPWARISVLETSPASSSWLLASLSAATADDATSNWTHATDATKFFLNYPTNTSTSAFPPSPRVQPLRRTAGSRHSRGTRFLSSSNRFPSTRPAPSCAEGARVLPFPKRCTLSFLRTRNAMPAVQVSTRVPWRQCLACRSIAGAILIGLPGVELHRRNARTNVDRPDSLRGCGTGAGPYASSYRMALPDQLSPGSIGAFGRLGIRRTGTPPAADPSCFFVS